MKLSWIGPDRNRRLEIWITEDEAKLLTDALDKYHSIDTSIKELIADDDVQHYFIEDLRDQIKDILTK